MADAQIWTFKQLGGQRKMITLSDYAAPFGRPRQKAIFEETLRDRVRTKYYPGNSGAPTRHLLGTQWENEGRMELTGRWMTKFLTKSTAKDLVERWHDFIRDEQRVSISWGNVASWTGIIESLKTGWESDNEVAWTLAILVDDRSNSVVSSFIPPILPDALARNFQQEFLKFSAKQVSVAADMSPDIFDVIDGLFSSVATFTSSLVKIANQLNDIQNKTFGTLQRLRLAIHEVKTAMIDFEETLDSIENSTALFSQQSVSDLKWFTFKTQKDVSFSVMREILADMDRQAQEQERGTDFTTYIARSGDTWVSISNEFYGGPEGGDKIRQANGIKFGEDPVPGRRYRIPS